MMSIYKFFGKKVFDLIPSDNRMFQVICQRYIDRYNGNNNSDPSSNGEELLLRSELSKLKGDVVFDVGANVGDWAKYALEIERSIQLHCFEPSFATFQKLSANNWPTNVCLNNFGLGETVDQLELNIVEPASGLNSIYCRQGVEAAKAISKETISISTIDSYCESKHIEHINFIKVDVEGHELAVFKGMSRMLRERRVNMIQFEYGGCNLDARVYLADIWEYLASFGFKFYKIFPSGPRAVSRYSQSLETFRYSNWFAVLTKVKLTPS